MRAKRARGLAGSEAPFGSAERGEGSDPLIGLNPAFEDEVEVLLVAPRGELGAEAREVEPRRDLEDRLEHEHRGSAERRVAHARLEGGEVDPPAREQAGDRLHDPGAIHAGDADAIEQVVAEAARRRRLLQDAAEAEPSLELRARLLDVRERLRRARKQEDE